MSGRADTGPLKSIHSWVAGPGWGRLGLLAGLLLILINPALRRSSISDGMWTRAGTAAIASARGTAFAAGMRGDRATAESNYRSQCASCHGTSGKGDGWRAWVFRLTMRDFGDAAYMRTLPDDYLFQIIKQGGANLGKPGMPSWGQELTDGEISELVVYIRGLATSRGQDPPAGTAR